MSRVIAVMACGFALAACSMSMPSLDFFKSTPPTEVLRVESEPPGADARTSQGQSCRTPCELTVPTEGELQVMFALNGYQPMTIAVKPEAPSGPREDGSTPTRMQPNPVYAELQPVAPARQKKKAVAKKKVSTAPKSQPPAQAPAQAAPAAEPAGSTTSAYPGNFPWPAPPATSQ